MVRDCHINLPNHIHSCCEFLKNHWFGGAIPKNPWFGGAISKIFWLGGAIPKNPLFGWAISTNHGSAGRSRRTLGSVGDIEKLLDWDGRIIVRDCRTSLPNHGSGVPHHGSGLLNQLAESWFRIAEPRFGIAKQTCRTMVRDC